MVAKWMRHNLSPLPGLGYVLSLYPTSIFFLFLFFLFPSLFLNIKFSHFHNPFRRISMPLKFVLCAALPFALGVSVKFLAPSPRARIPVMVGLLAGAIITHAFQTIPDVWIIVINVFIFFGYITTRRDLDGGWSILSFNDHKTGTDS